MHASSVVVPSNACASLRRLLVYHCYLVPHAILVGRGGRSPPHLRSLPSTLFILSGMPTGAMKRVAIICQVFAGKRLKYIEVAYLNFEDIKQPEIAFGGQGAAYEMALD